MAAPWHNSCVGNYTELYFHFVWSTHERRPLLTDDLEARVHRLIRCKCEALGVRVHALNGTADHVHLAASVPTSLALADLMHDIKGASSRMVNQHLGQPLFSWQERYGALTFAKRDLSAVVRYIDNQKEHHATAKLSEKMERLADDGDGA